MPGSSRPVYFATSNRGKIQEARIVLSPYGIEAVPFDGKGVEIQAETVSEVAAFSARAASRIYDRPLIVEDAGLFVEALGGFPGPSSSYVYKTLGIRGVLALLEGARSRRARFRSAVAFCEPTGEPRVFEGEVTGRISKSASGENGFGFDPVFIPSGGRRSMGALTLEEKCAISHRGESMRKFASWYTGPEAGQRF
ncbi:MAG: RdgB/HAM1 family non-canonical purine NTP pyrophosphatase [Thaumarchaeota archaeon]|nr:RdgB/HAM1 family non-canonical purine NTP pyrophosphatase [Nitrososphaerota archaeon]